MTVSASTQKSVLLTKGKVSNWDQDFCKVSQHIERLYPSGRVFNDKSLECTVEIVDQDGLMIPEEHFDHVIQFLVHEQRNGEEGFLPLEGCTVPCYGELFRLIYSPPGEDTCGWSLTE